MSDWRTRGSDRRDRKGGGCDTRSTVRGRTSKLRRMEGRLCLQRARSLLKAEAEEKEGRIRRKGKGRNTRRRSTPAGRMIYDISMILPRAIRGDSIPLTLIARVGLLESLTKRHATSHARAWMVI
jgi:hypothetical protein